MKRILILFLLFLVSKTTFSQNGGQFYENNVIYVRLIGYVNNNYIFTVKNKQSCTATIRTKIDNDPAVDYVVNSNDSIWVYIPRPPFTEVKFRSKAETACISNPDMGWLEVTTSLGVLSLNENNIIIPIRTPNTYKISLFGGILKSDFGNLSDKQTVIIYDGMGRTLFTQRILVVKKHEINLNNFLTTGLNFISVHIENKTYDHYFFKVIR